MSDPCGDDNKMMMAAAAAGGEESEGGFQRIADNATIGPAEVWERRTYVRAAGLSPISTTSFINFGRPSLLWLTVVVLGILNSVLFVLYVLDAIGVGFRSPVTLVASSGALFVLFCLLSLYAVFRLKTERIMQDWMRLVYITVCFTFVNLVSFLAFLIWALKNPGFWKDIDFEDDPKAHDGYVAANAFAAALFVLALLALWTAMAIHYYFVKLLETLNIAIVKAGSAGNLSDIMAAATEGGRKKYLATATTTTTPSTQQTSTDSYGRRTQGNGYDAEEADARRWRQ